MPSRHTSVRVVVSAGGRDRTARLRFDPSATAGELARALGAGEQPLRIDGVAVAPHRPLGGVALAEGAVVIPHDPPVAPTLRGATGGVAVVGGLDGGRLEPISVRATIGRGAGNDLVLESPTVSRRHAELVVDRSGPRVRDLGSRNGTWHGSHAVGTETVAVSGPLRLGAARLAVVDTIPPPPAPSPGSTRITIHRPPRVLPPPTDPPLPAPEPPAAPFAASAFSWAMVLAPLAVGFTLAVLFSPFLALFALLSPVMAVASWLEQRHRSRRGRRRASRRFADELAKFHAALEGRRCGAERRARDADPDPGELARRARAGAATLWERRSSHPDFLQLPVGTGDVAWEVPVRVPATTPLDPDVELALAEVAVLRDVPVAVDLAHDVVGIVGPRPARTAVARHLVLAAAVLHGPADLAIRAPGAPPWVWTSWLPHIDDDHDGAAIGDGDDAGGRRPRTTLEVVDIAPGAPRDVEPADHLRQIVLASSADELPASCTVVVELLDEHGQARVRWLHRHRTVDGVLASGVSESTASTTARALARFADPQHQRFHGVPREVGLVETLEIDRVDAATVLERWDLARCGASATIGVAAGGPFSVDLVADGPHALVAGTTGSGKSELLRALVLSLAATHPPDDVAVLLVDYKGGSAFDELAALPHCVGVVTDLDGSLADRVLRSLDAELRRREQLLRSHAAADLDAYRAGAADGREALPRLVVVVDELAAMLGAVEGASQALAALAQRGRSLGLHLVLASQHPAGVVTDAIRANTALRIALRVADRHDSTEVLGTAGAAAIATSLPGRAFVRRGTDAPIEVQVAFTRARLPDPVHVEVRYEDDATVPCDEAPVADSDDGAHAFVGAIVEAARRASIAPSRRPWLPPLPDTLAPDELATVHGTHVVHSGSDRSELSIAIGLVDDPDHQRQPVLRWRPADGNLLLFGNAASGAPNVLATMAVALARACDVGRCHLYAIDRTNAFTTLAGLPHCGSVVRADETARVRRLLRHLHGELRTRRASAHGEPRIVLLVDDLAAFATDHDDAAGLRLVDQLHEVLRDGPAVGVHVAMTTSRAGGATPPVLATLALKVVLRVADPYDLGLVGISVARPNEWARDRPVGRGITSGALEVQLAMLTAERLDQAVAEVGAQTPAGAHQPMPIGELPVDVQLHGLAPVADLHNEPWLLVLGIGDSQLAPCGLVLRTGDHALIAGPPRSGRSTALASVAAAASRGGARVLGLAPRPSPLEQIPGVEVVDRPATLGDRLAATTAPVLVVVDDAELVDDDDGVLVALIERADPLTHLVAAGRTDRLRAAYGHWSATLRGTPTGLALRPDLDLDGDLWGVRLPRHPELDRPGRGLLIVDGDIELVQVARP